MVRKRTSTATKHPPQEDVEDDLSIEYPSSDGEPMAETDFQYTALTNTVAALRHWFVHQTDVYIAGDMLGYYRKNDNTVRVAPDVYAVIGATGNHQRNSWLVWREGKAPDFVMEIASQGTWRRDVTVKRDIYANMGVTEYWRFDPTGECFTPALAGERLTDGEYREIPLATDAAGILRGRSALLGLDVCVLPGLELHLYDQESGHWLRTPGESEASALAFETALQATEAALLQEATARQAAEAAQQQEATARQAAEAAQQQEATARQAAEDEVRLLREQLRSRQSGQ